MEIGILSDVKTNSPQLWPIEILFFSKHIIKSAVIDGEKALAESSRLAWHCKVIT